MSDHVDWGAAFASLRKRSRNPETGRMWRQEDLADAIGEEKYVISRLETGAYRFDLTRFYPAIRRMGFRLADLEAEASPKEKPQKDELEQRVREILRDMLGNAQRANNSGGDEQ